MKFQITSSYIWLYAIVQATATLGDDIVTLPSLHNKAIEPSCSMVTFPVTTTCNIGIHTARRRNAAPTIPLPQKAIIASCSTVYSTTSSRWAGAHPQPTFGGAPLTVTTIKLESSNSGLQTATAVVTAQASISAPAPAASGSNFEILITPSLRDKVIETADKFCPTKRRSKRQSGLACALPESSRTEVLAEVNGLITNNVSLGRHQQNYSLYSQRYYGPQSCRKGP